MRSMNDRQVEAALLLGTVLESARQDSLRGVAPLPLSFDPEKIPPLRHACGLVVEEIEGEIGATLQFEIPGEGSRNVRLTPSSDRTVEGCLRAARAVLRRVSDFEHGRSRRAEGKRIFELASVQMPFDEAMIQASERTLASEIGHRPSPDEIKAYLTEFLKANRGRDVRVAIDRSPTAICFAAAAAGAGLRAWPVEPGESACLH